MLLIGSLQLLALADQLAASCHMRELSLCTISALSMFQNPNGLPVKQAEIERQCDMFEEATSCYADYGDRCMTGRQASLISLLLVGPAMELEKYFCDSASNFRASYVRAASCFRELQKKKQNTCLRQLQAGLERMAAKANHSSLLSFGCW